MLFRAAVAAQLDYPTKTSYSVLRFNALSSSSGCATRNISTWRLKCSTWFQCSFEQQWLRNSIFTTTPIPIKKRFQCSFEQQWLRNTLSVLLSTLERIVSMLFRAAVAAQLFVLVECHDRAKSFNALSSSSGCATTVQMTVSSTTTSVSMLFRAAVAAQP